MKTCPTCHALYPTAFALCPKDGAELDRIHEFPPGSTLRGKYEILAKLGQGGMGVVYKARHLHFDELRALKVVRSHLAEDREFLERFRTEAVIMRRLDHPHAVGVEDFDETEEGHPFMVMEYVEGESLDRTIAAGPLPPVRALGIAAQVAEALEAAHRLGILHRDIKPSNILLERGTDRAKVLDFGVARIKEGSPLLRTPSLTRTGLVIGTPDYMSPEQAQGTPGSELDGRSDLYSLGIVLYEMLTSELPFRAETPVEMLFHHVQSPPRNPRELVPSLPLPVVTLILRALEKQPAKRFPSAAAMRGELEAVAQELTAPTAESPSTALYGGSPQPQSPASTPPGAAGQAPTVRPEARGVAPAARRLSPKPQPPLQASQTLQQSRGRILAGLAVVIVVGIMLVAFRQLRSRSESPPTPPIAGEAVPEPTPSPSTQPVPPTPATGLAEPTLIPPAGEGHQAHPTASPDQIQQLLRQGWLALERGDPEAARRAFEKVLELEPTNQSAEQALRLLEPRNQRDKQTRALFQDARSALNRGDFESAARHFKAILALDPTNQLAQRGLEKARQARTSRPEPRRRRSD